MLSASRQQDTLKLTQAIIRAASYSGEEREAVGILRAYSQEAGFDDVYCDAYGSLIVKISGKRPGKRILFDGHIDTVRADQNEWTTGPFDATVWDGRLYGRGASDMKGALAAVFSAARFFSDDCSRDFPGEIYLAAVVQEECFEGVAARSVSEYVKPDAVVICEASEMNVKNGQRGRAEIVVETFGKSAHSANPEMGCNAVYAMMKLIDGVRAIEAPVHPKLGKGIMELTDIKSEPYPGASVVPSYCRATYDRRLLVGETPESVLAPIEAVIAGMRAQDPRFEAKASIAHGHELCYTGNAIEGDRFFPGWLMDESAPLIQSVLEELRAIGERPELTQYNFCTNGSHYAGERHIPTIGFGPSRENLAHTTDEYIELDELFRSVECYEAICTALLKKT